MATWPSTLPHPLRSGYTLEPQDATVRTDMDVGPARVRRRTRSAPDTITLSWLFDAAQMAAFRAFWDDEWNAGAAWVVIPLRDGTSTALVSRECRPRQASFKAAVVSSSHWQVDMTIEVRHA